MSVEAVDAKTLPDFCRIVAAGWGLDADEERARFAPYLDASERGFFLATHRGEPAGAAGMVVRPRCSYLVGAVVLPAFRARGLYQALVHARLEHTAARGLTLATTHAREETSAPILERLGFDTVARFRVYSSVTS